MDSQLNIENYWPDRKPDRYFITEAVEVKLNASKTNWENYYLNRNHIQFYDHFFRPK